MDRVSNTVPFRHSVTRSSGAAEPRSPSRLRKEDGGQGGRQSSAPDPGSYTGTSVPSRGAASSRQDGRGAGPSSNHFRFRYGRRGRWRERFSAEGWGWQKHAVVHRRIGVLRLRIRRRCFGYYGLLAMPHGNRRPMEGRFMVARETLAARWRQLAIRTRLRSSPVGIRRVCRRETVRAASPRWSSVAFACSTGVVQTAGSRPDDPASGGQVELRSGWLGEHTRPGMAGSPNAV